MLNLGEVRGGMLAGPSYELIADIGTVGRVPERAALLMVVASKEVDDGLMREVLRIR